MKLSTQFNGNQAVKLLLAVYSISIMTACGGGSGGSVAEPTVTTDPTKSFAFRSAVITNSQTPSNYSLSGSIELKGEKGTVSGSITAGSLSSTTFEGNEALVAISVVTLNAILPLTNPPDGRTTTVPLNSTGKKYYSKDMVPLGSESSEYEVVYGAVNIPLSVKVNDTGEYMKATRYTNSSKSTALGTSTYTYAVKSNNLNSLFVDIIAADKDTFNKTIVTYTTRYILTDTGEYYPTTRNTIDYSSNIITNTIYR